MMHEIVTFDEYSSECMYAVSCSTLSVIYYCRHYANGVILLYICTELARIKFKLIIIN